MVNFSSVKQSYLTNLSAFSASKRFLMLDHTKSYVDKIHSIDAELAGHAHKRHVKLQRLCGSGFCLLCACLSSVTT